MLYLCSSYEEFLVKCAIGIFQLLCRELPMLEVEELRSLDMTVIVENPLLILVSFLFLHLKTLLSSLLK